MSECKIEKDKHTKNMFYISGTHLKRTFVLKAVNEKECDQWISKLREVVHRLSLRKKKPKNPQENSNHNKEISNSEP